MLAKFQLELIQQTDSNDLLQNLSAKTLALKIYYEIGAYELLRSHLDAMRTFLNRKKIQLTMRCRSLWIKNWDSSSKHTAAKTLINFARKRAPLMMGLFYLDALDITASSLILVVIIVFPIGDHIVVVFKNSSGFHFSNAHFQHPALQFADQNNSHTCSMVFM